MPKPIAFLIFLIVEIVLLPITLIGYVWWAVGVFPTNRRAGVSVTAYKPLLSRWMMHEAGTRADEASKRVLMALPGASPLAFQMLMGPTFLAMRLIGVELSLVKYPPARPSTPVTAISHRTEFLDKALLDHLDKVTQVVILGAGWDTRAYNLSPGAEVLVFEVDTAEMQSIKRKALQNAGIDTTYVTFVTADFNKEPWLETLKRYDFDPGSPTFFLWEGVIYYLEAEAVHATLDAISSQCAGGSAIAFDYYGSEYIIRNLAKVTRLSGEPLQFGVPTDPPARQQVVNLLEAHGLKLERFEPFGEESADSKPFGGLAVAVSVSKPANQVS